MHYNDFNQLSTEFIAHSGMVNTSTSPKIQYSYASGASESNQIRQTSVTYPSGRVIDFDYGTTGGVNMAIEVIFESATENRRGERCASSKV